MDHSDNAVYSDMPDYYKYMSSPTGDRYDLNPIIEETAGGGSVNQVEFCHPIIFDSLGSIDQL